jgi:CRISPR-associated endoribonuclease Cas6
MYDLSSIQLILHPQKTNRVPRWLGRATQALFFHTLRDIHAEIATYLHDYPRLKPFTVSNLTGAHPLGELVELRPYQRLRLRFTTLHPHVTSLVWNGLLPIWKRGIRLHDQRFYVAEVETAIHPCINYALLLAKAHANYDTLTLHFTSPTAFKITGKSGYSAQPDPALIFMSLYRNWNEFSAQRLPKTLEAVIRTQIQAQADVISEPVKIDKGQQIINIRGFMGTVNFFIQTEDETMRRYLYALTQYAPYCGVGIKTTIGLGQVR